MATSTESKAATIRHAEAADIRAIERLLMDNHLPILGIHEALGTFLVAVVGGELVGVAGLEIRGSHALLRSVAVRDEWRSRGVGRDLVHAAIADAETHGLEALYLLTTTAERYFPSFGFQVVEREQVPQEIQTSGEYRVACPTSATVMRRPVKKP